jgi:hypothetical protein
MNLLLASVLLVSATHPTPRQIPQDAVNEVVIDSAVALLTEAQTLDAESETRVLSMVDTYEQDFLDYKAGRARQLQQHRPYTIEDYTLQPGDYAVEKAIVACRIMCSSRSLDAKAHELGMIAPDVLSAGDEFKKRRREFFPDVPEPCYDD